MRGTHHRYFTIGLRRPLATHASITIWPQFEDVPSGGRVNEEAPAGGILGRLLGVEHERLDWKNQAQKAPTEGRVNFPPSGSDSGGVVPFP